MISKQNIDEWKKNSTSLKLTNFRNHFGTWGSDMYPSHGIVGRDGNVYVPNFRSVRTGLQTYKEVKNRLIPMITVSCHPTHVNNIFSAVFSRHLSTQL
jgi:hypothetical protein